MPSIYLSPSTQESNEYVTGGSEEYHMNLVADAMEPYLRASGIHFTRNTPQMTARSSIRASNAGNYDLHLALHSNAAPPGRAGTVRGSDIYYAPNSVKGQTAANIIAENIRDIYPEPNLVRAIPTTSIGEVVQTRAPSAFIELAYHDNEEDARLDCQQYRSDRPHHRPCFDGVLQYPLCVAHHAANGHGDAL